MMNIPKAIEILHLLFGHIYEGSELDRDTAIKLGIEALKRLEQNRTLHFVPSLKLLEGETKD